MVHCCCILTVIKVLHFKQIHDKNAKCSISTMVVKDKLFPVNLLSNAHWQVVWIFSSFARSMMLSWAQVVVARPTGTKVYKHVLS